MRSLRVMGLAVRRRPLSASWHTAASSVGPPGKLFDSFGRNHTYLRISLTEKCSLRCQYCMPENGVPLTAPDELLSADEIYKLAAFFVENGVTKIRFTGGEPLVRPDVESIVRRVGTLRSSGLKYMALTTNGLVLEKKLPSLIESGLTAVNISLDTLDADKFETVTRRKGWSNVIKAISAAEKAQQLSRVKVNCVVMRGINDSELADFVALTRHRNIDVRFIEYMPFDGNKWSSDKIVPYAEMVKLIQMRYPTFAPLILSAEEKKNDDGISKPWHVPGFSGRVGFISSMSDDFCGTCNRLRLTADGNLKVCLFGEDEVSLRDALRSPLPDASMRLRLLVENALSKKFAHHGGFNAEELVGARNRPMITIGG